MNAFTKPLDEYSEIVKLRESIQKNRFPIRVSGCMDSQKSNLIAAVGGEHGSRLIVAPDELKAKEILNDIRLYDKDALFYPTKDIIFYSSDIRGNAIVQERLRCIRRLLEGEGATIVTSFSAGMDKVLPLARIAEHVIRIDMQSTIDMDVLSTDLVAMGYERRDEASDPGEFAIRGGIVDIYPLADETPYRIELWGDEIDSIRRYDASTQRTIENIDSVMIYPAVEIFLDEDAIASGLAAIEREAGTAVTKLRSDFRTEEAANVKRTVGEFRENLEYLKARTGIDSYIDYFTSETVSFFDYFKGENDIVFIDEPARMAEAGEAAYKEFSESMKGRLEKGYVLPGQMNAVFDNKRLMAGLAGSRTVMLSALDYRFAEIPAKDTMALMVRSISSYNGDFEMLVSELTGWKKQGYRIVLLTSSVSRSQRLAQDLRDRELSAFTTDDPDRAPTAGEILVASGGVTRGFEYPLIKFAVISETDIFGKQKAKHRKKLYEGTRIPDFTELKPGDYVVHETYGVGIYRGIEMIQVDHVNKDYIKVEYSGGDALYVRATAMDALQKYSGPEGRQPKLNKLDTTEWKNTKSRVRGAVKEIAAELVQLYALRQAKQGFRFGADTVWQREFEEMFPYEETDDQLKAIEETKRDMESTRIMDRLICGDVGYGKTEIAIRAAFKAVQDGKQVAFLVPTTILAQQHYNTFVQRMSEFPVHIDMLSRFRTATEQKKCIAKLKSGQLDVVIGTHRLLSKDVSFKDLGLLIIDEEQRFGVTHKEKIKQMKGDVDVLTLTATPIPRTMHMSLIGIRDMSVLDEAPVDRLPIQTFVMEHNDETIREAINRELARNGQIYYVYNRVNGIAEMAAQIAALVPDANVVYAHGQMNEHELERIMLSFVNGEIDVLVATTIIETGLDISNVNTIIIDDADRLGLSQLYQLRGRVGRSSRTAYAFLMYRRDRELREEAEKRLSAIREFTELGSGFKIAMRDLEIRGAGNMLGAEQSGHMEAVGYDLYCKLLNEAVRTLKDGDTEIDVFETAIDVDMDAYIPGGYIPNELQKLDMYKRIALISNKDELADMQEELTDRYQEMPKAVDNLLHVALLKARAHQVYVTSVSQKKEKVRLDLYEKAKLDVGRLPELMSRFDKRLRLTPGKAPWFEFTLVIDRRKGHLTPEDVFMQLGELFDAMEEIVLK